MGAWFERGCINSEFLQLFRGPGLTRRCTSPAFVICAQVLTSISVHKHLTLMLCAQTGPIATWVLCHHLWQQRFALRSVLSHLWVCHGQDTVWELVVDIHYIGVQVRGGPEFSVGDEFVLGRAVVFVPMRQPQQNDVLCAGCFSGVLKRMVLLRQGWRCHSLQCRIVTSDTRSRVAHHSTTHSTSDME